MIKLSKLYKIKIKLKRILTIKRKRKMSKIEIGRTYIIKKTPKGKRTSNCVGTKVGHPEGVKINITRIDKNNLLHGHLIDVTSKVVRLGFSGSGNYSVYDYELVLGPYNKEAIQKDIDEVNKKKKELDQKIDDLNSKMEWIDEVGVDVFDEDEFKVYRTLSLLEDDNVSKITKMKEIAKLIRQ